MKIGVMLRGFDEKQGTGIYSQNLMDHILPLDKNNEYILFYRNPKFLGRYSRYSHVREKLVNASNKAIWDQVKIPIEAVREKVDIIFNTKFSVPLFTRIKTVCVLHGSAWYIDPQSYKKLDLFYIKMILPIYHRKADMVISVSNQAKEDMSIYTGANPNKFKTVYSAPDDRFFQETDEDTLQEVTDRYKLPERFILNVGSISRGKNIKTMLQAYGQLHKRLPHKLVIAGIPGYHNSDELAPIEEYGLQDSVIFPGWVPQQDMPSFYKLADLFLLPSWYESCSVALLEAMASSCPIVTSNTGGTPELTGNAAILVNPSDPDAIANSVYNVLMDEQYRQQLIRYSREQSMQFSWETCAKGTLAVLESLNTGESQNGVLARYQSVGPASSKSGVS